MGNLHGNLSDYQQGKKYYERAMSIQLNNHGPDHGGYSHFAIRQKVASLESLPMMESEVTRGRLRVNGLKLAIATGLTNHGWINVRNLVFFYFQLKNTSYLNKDIFLSSRNITFNRN